MADPILSMRDIRKTFGSIKALRGVDLTIWPGEIHALMGENGAGKSTLMKILSGAQRADPGGTLVVNGETVPIQTPADARRLGIAVIYQELALAPNLSVSENIALGREKHRKGLIDRKSMRRECVEILGRLGASFGPETKVNDLSIADRQLVEIARALSLDARILVMDEPTTALSSRETDKLFDLVRKLRDEGLAIIYISHRMAEVYELADRCSVLRDGSHVGTLDRSELSAAALVKLMVGRDLTEFYKKQYGQSAPGPVVLDVLGLVADSQAAPASFSVRKGEVVALAGLVGSGRTELARLIYGADRSSGGAVNVEGVDVTPRNPADAIAAGIVYLTEDRKAQGLFLDMTLEDNINFNVMGRDARHGWLRRFGKARERAAKAFADLSIKAPNAKVTAGSLSGGNQQKVLLARLLETRPKVLILDEPTRGVDIGAKSDIYQIIDQLAAEGAAVLVISSELPEVVGLADRVLVMRDGEIAGELVGDDINQEAIIAIATNATSNERTDQ